jgi:hypothetical protein
MRRFAAVAAAVGLVVGAGVASGASGPSLRIVDRSPFVVAGSGFPGGVSVLVTVRTTRPFVRRVNADADGSFVARFGKIAPVRCAALRVAAAGGGKTAVVAFMRPLCIPAPRTGGGGPGATTG